MLKLILFLLLCLPTSAQASLVLISTREAPNDSIQTEKLQYWKYNGEDWTVVSRKAVVSKLPLTVFVHGNRTKRSDSIQTGHRIYQQLPERDQIQFVIWSWPSDRIPGPRKDAVLKAGYCDAQAYYLATYLHDAEVSTTLVGHSFGARIITGAMQLLAGGEIGGRQFPAQTRQVRTLVLLAAAIDEHCFEPGHRHDQVPYCSHIMVTRNPSDPVLQLYPRMFRPVGSPAMGLKGPTITSCCNIINLRGTVGRSHALQDYLKAPGILELFTESHE